MSIKLTEVRDYVADADLLKAIKHMPYNLGLSVMEAMNLPVAYHLDGGSYYQDDAFDWVVFKLGDSYIECQSNTSDLFLTVYDSLEELVDHNDHWLSYDEESDDFNVVDYSDEA